MLHKFAFWIIRTSDEPSEAPFALHKPAVFAFRARFADLFRRGYLATVLLARAEALREFCTAHEAARARQLIDHSTSTERAGEFRRRIAHVRQFFYVRFAFYGLRKRAIETLKCFCIFTFSIGYLVELILHFCRERVADVIREMILQESRNDIAGVGRKKSASLLIHVPSVFKRFDDSRVRRRPPYAALFKFFDETGLAVSPGRLGFFSFRTRFNEPERISLRDFRKFNFFAACGRVGLEPPVEHDARTSCREKGDRKLIYLCGECHALHTRIRHLACHRARPDKHVQFFLLIGRARTVLLGIRRTHRFVRFLRGFALRFIRARRYVFFAELARNRRDERGLRFLCEVGAVGAHIRNVSGLI